LVISSSCSVIRFRSRIFPHNIYSVDSHNLREETTFRNAQGRGSRAEKRRIRRERDREERQQERKKESGKKEEYKREEGKTTQKKREENLPGQGDSEQRVHGKV
jgi:hypothetical protein